MSGAGDEGGPKASEGEDRSSSSSFEDLATAEVEEAKREEAAEKAKELTPEKEDAEGEWQDVLGSGVLLKKIVKRGEDEGEDALRPQRGDVCRVVYELSLRDGNGPGALIEKRDVKIYLGDNEVLQGMDLAISLMYKNEVCQLQISPRFGYGARGLNVGDATGAVGAPDGETYSGPAVSPQAWLYAELQLQGWSEEPEHETLSFAERMQVGGRRRARGNWWYERGEAPLAVQLYRRALDVLDESTGGISEPTPTGENTTTSDALQALLEERIRIHNNMAAAQLKAGAYDAALQAVNRVLTCQPDNAKALFRKTKILSAMGRGSEALESARAAAVVASGDPAVKKELHKCEAQATRDRSAERRLARRMLGADAPKPDKPKKPSRTKMFIWGSLLLSLVVGVASVLVYRYRTQSH